MPVVGFSPTSFARLCVGLGHKDDDIIDALRRRFGTDHAYAIKLVTQAKQQNTNRLDAHAVEAEHEED